MKQVNSFSPETRWIWAPDEKILPIDNWWMFRRIFTLPKDCFNSQIRITAAFQYLLYINDTFITCGPARSYDFCKAYDTVDIQPYLRPGNDNVVAILAPAHKLQNRRGILAELCWHNVDGKDNCVSTNRQWRVKRHPSFAPEVAGCSPAQELLLWVEERFDARKEPNGWKTPGFEDNDWDSAVEIGPAIMPPFISLEPSGIPLLSNDPVMPHAVTSIELSLLRPGYRFRFVVPETNINDIKVYATEVVCTAPVDIKIHVDANLTLDGQEVAGNQLRLTSGRHILCLCQRGYYKPELEVLFETEIELTFSASRIVGNNASWAWQVFPVSAVNYPWHEKPANIPDPIELTNLLKAQDAGLLPSKMVASLAPAYPRDTSIAFDVRTQTFYRVRGGYSDPMLEKTQPRLPSDDSLFAPLRNHNNLLHTNADPATLLPTHGYDSHFIVDFGIEIIGYLEFMIDAPADAIIDMQAFEYIGPKGIAWMTHNGFRYQCREGLQTFISHIRRGFRYVSVTVRNFDRPVKWYYLRCRRSAYPIQQSGYFECNDWQLNHIWQMSIETSALCMLDTYVDCPGHEQSFWVGDAPITGLINLLNFGAYDLDQRSIRLVGQSLSKEWVREFRPDDERYISEHYLPIAAFPDYPPEGGLPMWPLLWLIQCWNHYFYGSDIKDMQENYAYVVEMLRRCRLLTNKRGLLDIPGAWNLLDWGNNDLSPYGEVTANNMHVVLGLRLAARMARTLEKMNDAKELEAEANKLQSIINQLCWDEKQQAYVDTVRDEWAYKRSQDFAVAKGWLPLTWDKFQACCRISEQTNIAALFCGCVPDDRLKAVMRILRRVELGRFVPGSPANRTIGSPSQLEAPDGIVSLGTLYFLFFALDVLFNAGLEHEAIEIIRKEWGQMAELGFKTCPESQGWSRSAAHGWSASPAIYLQSHVLGIRPIEPGYRTFVVDPVSSELSWARGSVNTPYGPIHANWKRTESGQLKIECIAPAECRQVEYEKGKLKV